VILSVLKRKKSEYGDNHWQRKEALFYKGWLEEASLLRRHIN
jgi:hypothetical protein